MYHRDLAAHLLLTKLPCIQHRSHDTTHYRALYCWKEIDGSQKLRLANYTRCTVIIFKIYIYKAQNAYLYHSLGQPFLACAQGASLGLAMPLFGKLEVSVACSRGIACGLHNSRVLL